MAAASLRKEEDFNAQEFRRRLGGEVEYGHVVQLRHVNSGRFLTVFPRRLAVMENSCLRVGLSPHGSFDCWLVIKPRFKVHSIGDNIEIADYVNLEFRQRPGEFVHAGEAREVNCAVGKPTAWKTLFYAHHSSDPTASRPALRFGSSTRRRSAS